MSNEIETLREKIARQNKKIRKLLLNIAEQGVTIKLIMKGLAEADGENHRTVRKLRTVEGPRVGSGVWYAPEHDYLFIVRHFVCGRGAPSVFYIKYDPDETPTRPIVFHAMPEFYIENVFIGEL